MRRAACRRFAVDRDDDRRDDLTSLLIVDPDHEPIFTSGSDSRSFSTSRVRHWHRHLHRLGETALEPHIAVLDVAAIAVW